MQNGQEIIKVRSFEDLWIWQEARVLVSEIYFNFREGTPGAKDFGFKDQIQRAGIGIMNNIAEGFELNTIANYTRHLEIAKGSCGETRSMYYVAEDQHYVSPEVALQRRARATKISKGIQSLAKRLRSPASSSSPKFDSAP